jgi:hypothetical protein
MLWIVQASRHLGSNNRKRERERERETPGVWRQRNPTNRPFGGHYVAMGRKLGSVCFGSARACSHF